ncbi:response regulator transcription factor [Francisella adeliensis]|uniref:DNA-binding response regulator n=1 Tax=Francisella adeliensis TaxID=2007306 RepID=A0A2Z4Y0T1_9GAMM|nr:response regulator transcription factor [Francisella adeliensis]AXA34342.1 DNA-binding response regulator [Francisella adeliensis]MBK2084669.1 response regulator transcription factor [Francisella adeliensis]MBK2096178.1 response regulator transcription factor [Francisella adeliensis]QIW12589.1 response regulator transcription factor [Francisella adeliensis]QIW14462.1 response regulator transcription factor [Francisella adeliensis]
MKKILIVEDDLQIRRFLEKTFLVLGYDVDCVDSTITAKEYLTQSTVDVIILDLGLPDDDGQNLIPIIRQNYKIPIIVLSARSDTTEVVKALDAGANDYVKKPFDMPELVARVKSVITNSILQNASQNQLNQYSFDNLMVDVSDRKVLIDGEQIHLSKKEFLILQKLVINSGKLVLQDDVLRDVWGEYYGDGAQYLRVYIGQLRKKLSDCNKQPLITTENAIGYRFIGAD